MSQKEKIVIIGAGPAGLTAAFELAEFQKYEIVVLESQDQVGGISKTVDFKGNKIDIGGHRFFSKSDWVLEWWQKFMPIESSGHSVEITYQNGKKTIKPVDLNADEDVDKLLIRPRKSRIYFNKHLFDYPLKLNLNTILGIGVFRSLKIFVSLLYSKLSPIQEEKSLEDFYINRFGFELYKIFFKDYTKKVWGRECSEISADWGRQRVKGLGVKRIIKHYLTTLFYPQRQNFGNKQVEQTLTEYFLYPPKGPGQLWEKVAQKCEEKGVTIKFHQTLMGLSMTDNRISKVVFRDTRLQTKHTLSADYVISTMPVKNLIDSLGAKVPKPIAMVAEQLEYRDFIIVGLQLRDLHIKRQTGYEFNDNWVYIQERHVQVGRVQFFNNWSPQMSKDPNVFWIGAEYFCEKGDDLWVMNDADMISFAVRELESIGIIESKDFIDGTVVRMPKAYPSYVGIYKDFPLIRQYLNSIDNLFPVGRNGTHKYNNQDHSMITAREAVNNISKNILTKENIWEVNLEGEYHEEQKE